MIMKRTSIIITAALGIGLAACANPNSQSGDGKAVNDSTEIIVKKGTDKDTLSVNRAVNKGKAIQRRKADRGTESLGSRQQG